MCHTRWQGLLKRKSQKRRRSHYAPCGEPQPSQCRFTDVAPWDFSDLAPWSALGRNAEFTEDRELAGLSTPQPNSWCDRERWSPAFRLRRSAPFGSVLQGPSNSRLASLAETSKCLRPGPFRGP